ncbi:RNA 2',3'-cyclic phosphodiesterase [Sphingomonas cavernae]|uniref:RNA 2',3'-cyclic phosphodiesterase n=1 Tax=Sphingomonas cavernae TaxID=2320861 RepID=A0A418WL76_9SPHN|nr:RNA 2',3'-cyclic phosphodiesterase [Sphingomonas cavernae]RJF90804.1 RNA 2',3'-cyclic phosphodiesterase [Sphingomonas cavernae]
MHRLFAAIRPPAAIRQHLLGLMGGVPRARWQDDDQLHLTLRFIGEVDRHTAADVAAALGQVRQQPFEIMLSGIGTFDRKGRTDTLWAGVAPHDQLTLLHNKIDQSLARIGLAPETRAYLPHLTLARLGRDTGRLDGFAESHGGLSSDPFTVTHFMLFESTLGNQGARYDVVERYALTP